MSNALLCNARNFRERTSRPFCERESVDKAATDLAASVAYASGGAMVEEPLRTRPDLT